MKARCLDVGSPIVYQISAGSLPQRPTSSDIATFCDQISESAADGVDLFQIREKHLSANDLFRVTRAAADATRQSPMRILLNERADIAMAAGIDGVHLSSTAMPVEGVRRIVGDSKLIAVSTHSSYDVRRAAADGVDLVVIGPIFETGNKNAQLTVAELSEISSRFPQLPIVALGGIDAENVESVMVAGVAGIAAIRSLGDRIERCRLLAKLK